MFFVALPLKCQTPTGRIHGKARHWRPELSKFQRFMAFSVAAIPFMAFALWSLSRLAGRPFSVGAACAIAVAIGTGLIYEGFQYPEFFKDREVPRMKRCPFCAEEIQQAAIGASIAGRAVRGHPLGTATSPRPPAAARGPALRARLKVQALFEARTRDWLSILAGRWDEATKPKVVSEPNGAARFGVFDCSLKYYRMVNLGFGFVCLVRNGDRWSVVTEASMVE